MASRQCGQPVLEGDISEQPLCSPERQAVAEGVKEGERSRGHDEQTEKVRDLLTETPRQKFSVACSVEGMQLPWLGS